MLTDADIGPKNFYLGPVKPKVSFNEWLGYFLSWQAMIGDLWPATYVFYLPQTDLGWNKFTCFEKKKI